MDTRNAPQGLEARKSALRLLDAVLRRGEPLDQARHSATKHLALPQDKALALAIAQETLRFLPDIDALIDSTTRQALPDDVKARMVLRIALAQVLRLKTPSHAAIATALPLLAGGPKRLVHGVLGTLLRKGVALPDAPTLPEAVAARWRAAHGEAMVEAAARALADAPPLDLTLRDPAETGLWTTGLEGESLASGHVRIARAGPVEALPGYDAGAWWVQDLAASLPARLLGEGDGRTVLDLCAAPGGKALQLAAMGWRVRAVDTSQRRMKRLTENAERCRLPVEPIVADLLKWQPEAPVPAILLDAPCSATGIFRRHPDVIHRIGPAQIAELAELQHRLLARAAGWLEPGGTLVYATCSLEPEEGEAQVERFLAEHPHFERRPVADPELPPGIAPTATGDLRTLPHMLAERGSLDGFFVARLSRSG